MELIDITDEQLETFVIGQMNKAFIGINVDEVFRPKCNFLRTAEGILGCVIYEVNGCNVINNWLFSCDRAEWKTANKTKYIIKDWNSYADNILSGNPQYNADYLADVMDDDDEPAC